MIIKTYEDMELLPIDKTPISSQIFKFACDLTMKKADDISKKKIGIKLVRQILNGEHTSIFEHSSMTFLARGISRSLLAQVTRQRTFSFTSASQHYQDYRNYPMSLRPRWDESSCVVLYEKALQFALDTYITLVNNGELPEEARQILPNACTVNLLITANPRALVKFLRDRLCDRNTQEMQIFAHKLHNICNGWIPELFPFVGPACYMDGLCNQGKMSCKKNSTK